MHNLVVIVINLQSNDKTISCHKTCMASLWKRHVIEWRRQVIITCEPLLLQHFSYIHKWCANMDYTCYNVATKDTSCSIFYVLLSLTHGLNKYFVFYFWSLIYWEWDNTNPFLIVLTKSRTYLKFNVEINEQTNNKKADIIQCKPHELGRLAILKNKLQLKYYILPLVRSLFLVFILIKYPNIKLGLI